MGDWEERKASETKGAVEQPIGELVEWSIQTCRVPGAECPVVGLRLTLGTKCLALRRDTGVKRA